jgi:hypothetical protein
MASRQRCAICRQPSAAGGRLCVPCRSALKRARDTTVSEAWLPRRRPRRPRASPPVSLPAAAVAVVPDVANPRDRAFRRPVAATLVLLAAVTGVALAITQLREPEALAPRYAVTEGQGVTDPISAAKVLPSPAANVVPAVAVPAVEMRPPEVDDADEPIEATPAARPVQRLSTSARTTPAVPVASTTAETAGVAAFGPVEEAAPPPAPARVAVLAPPAPARPPPDRWQRLADALARCPDDLIARSVCQQSLRLEHCGGAWGRVASCPAPVERDYGN